MLSNSLSTSVAAPAEVLADSLEAQVGATPLLQLRRTAVAHHLPSSVTLLAKAEWYNPGGSVKARAALNIILTAEREGLLRPGLTLLDSTSGNMGIAYALFGAARDFRVKLTLPSNVSRERIAILRAYGAELVFTDPLAGSDGAILEARRLAVANPTLYYANQYNNEASWLAHYHSTGPEIWEQTAGAVTHFVAGLGTSGTFTGTSRRLKAFKPGIQVISMQPASPFNGLEGLKHMDTAIKPGIYDERLADENMTVKTEAAYKMARFLAHEEGLFVGVSAAAAVVAAVETARSLTAGVVVTILPDNGLKYLSEAFWSV